MKTLSLLTIALVLFVGAGSEVYGQCDRNINSPIRCGYYDEGFQDGVSDAQNRRSNDYQRYRNKFERQYESFYRDGYRAGYASVPSWGRWTVEQRAAYDNGYNVGFSDRQLGRSSAPESRQGESAFNVRPYFFQGYMDGYSGVPRRYDFEIGNPGGGGGWPGGGGGWPGGGGGSTGSVIWNGRVDDRARLYIQGNRTWIENISGNGASQGSVQWQGTLPRRDTNVSVRTLSGRGSVNMAEQPSRMNNYRAAIDIYDPQGGSANYRLEITWEGSSSANPNYAPGRATWRGRVDDRVNIYVSGTDIWDETISGGMTQNAFGTVMGYLAARNGTVTVNRVRGRGTATVIQQPSRANGYTAVIQISDPRSGADDYEIDVSW